MTKKNLIFGLSIMLMVTLFVGCSTNDPVKTYEERVVVANRGGSSISFIDANSNGVISTLPIVGSEPMYVVYVPLKDKLFVGDRAQNLVHIVNPQTKAVENSIPVGNGVFHMWADGQGKQLWVNNDADNTTSVIDLNTNTVIQTISLGIKPHDVFLTNDATKAYISVINSDITMPDKIFLYSTSSFTKTTEINVGKDPHLYHLSNSNKLFVPCQSGQLYALNGDNLTELSNIPLTGAHGIFPTPDQNTVFVTNISGSQLYSINSINYTQNRPAISSQGSTPHNIVVNEAGNKMFVTHSGMTANTLSTYSISSGTITPTSTVTIGTNPFGLAYYRREVK